MAQNRIPELLVACPWVCWVEKWFNSDGTPATFVYYERIVIARFFKGSRVEIAIWKQTAKAPTDPVEQTDFHSGTYFFGDKITPEVVQAYEERVNRFRDVHFPRIEVSDLDGEQCLIRGILATPLSCFDPHEAPIAQ